MYDNDSEGLRQPRTLMTKIKGTDPYDMRSGPYYSLGCEYGVGQSTAFGSGNPAPIPVGTRTVPDYPYPLPIGKKPMKTRADGKV